MAVVVQRLVHADTAGVLFTRDPHDPKRGADARSRPRGDLGEAVVCGRVTPDSFQVSRGRAGHSSAHGDKERPHHRRTENSKSRRKSKAVIV